MALVTVDAVVHIPADSLVICVGLVFQMAIGALEHRIVVRVGVARGAHPVGIAVIDVELRVLAVIEAGGQPGAGVVAGLASGGEKLGLRCVSRIGGSVVVGLVASDAGGRQRGVVVVDVAHRALRRRDGVHAGQRERRVVVVEHCVSPQDGVMADLALLRESHRDVIWGGCALEVRLVAGNARGAGQVVIIVDVTVAALQRRHGVCTHQWEAGAGVIELAVRPQNRVVTIGAGGGDSRGQVGERADRVVIVSQMARYAGRIGEVVVVVDVAVGALQRRNGVASGQRKAGAVVIERGIQPGRGVMALLARLGKIGGHVIGMGSALEIRQVARHASGSGDVVVVIDVAVGAEARRDGVHSGQREAGAVVIESGVQP